MATAIGGEHADLAQREQALIIAESELTLLRVRAIRTSIVEQMLLATGAADTRDPSEQLLRRRRADVIGIEQLRRLERYERARSPDGKVQFENFWISNLDLCCIQMMVTTYERGLGKTKPNQRG